MSRGINFTTIKRESHIQQFLVNPVVQPELNGHGVYTGKFVVESQSAKGDVRYTETFATATQAYAFLGRHTVLSILNDGVGWTVLGLYKPEMFATEWAARHHVESYVSAVREFEG